MAHPVLLERAFGANVGQVATSAVVAQVVASNSNRRTITMTNTGNAAIFVGPTNGVLATTGHAIPAGASVQLRHYAGAIWAISAAAQTLTFLEEVVT